METINHVQKQSTVAIHHFTCDGCGKDIGSSWEWDDGHYNELGRYEQKVLLSHKWYKYHANFCEECARAKTEELVTIIKELGFF